MQNNNSDILETHKIYALVIEARNNVFLSVHFAKSLEEAFLLAKLEYERTNGEGSSIILEGGKIGLFTIKSIDEITGEQKRFLDNLNSQEARKQDRIKKINDEKIEVKRDVKKKQTPLLKNKNELIQEIIDNPEKLKEYKDRLTESEIKYIKSHYK